jgi:hypothetical protein
LRKLILSAFLLALCCLPAAAQDYPKIELFGGYQYTHLEGGFNGNGWNLSATGNLNHWFGVAADLSGAYDSGVHSHAFLFGPVVSYRKSDKLTPFAHVLLGDTRITVSGLSGSTNAFTTAFGGGFDTKLRDHISWRIIQADWMLTRFAGATQSKNARISTGIIFHF